MIKYELFIYEPNDNFNIPKFINTKLEEQKENYTAEYLIFAQQDIINNMIDKDKTCQSYVDFCDEFNFPFGMYQYYNNFNRILPNKNNIPNPALIIHSDNHSIVDIVKQYAYGFLIINTKAFLDINFKFNENYSLMFYLQDMIQNFYEKKLIFSNYLIPELHNSYTLFNNKMCYFINKDLFEKEKTEYFKNNQNITYVDIQKGIDAFKEKYYPTIKSPEVVNNTNNSINEIQALVGKNTDSLNISVNGTK